MKIENNVSNFFLLAKQTSKEVETPVSRAVATREGDRCSSQPGLSSPVLKYNNN